MRQRWITQKATLGGRACSESLFEIKHDKIWRDEMLTSLRSSKFFLKHKLKSHIGNMEHTIVRFWGTEY